MRVSIYYFYSVNLDVNICIFSGVHGVESVQETLTNAALDTQSAGQISVAKRGSPYKRLPAWSVYYGKRSAENHPAIDNYIDKESDDTEPKGTDTKTTGEFDQYDKMGDIVSELSKRASFKRLHSWMSTYGKRGVDLGEEGKIDGLESDDEDALETLDILDNDKWDSPMFNDYKFGEQEKRIPGWSATYGKRIPGWSATYGKRVPGWSATYGKRSVLGDGMPAAYIKRAPHWTATYGKRIPGWSATYGKRAMWKAIYGKRFNNRNLFSDQLNALREHLNFENNDHAESKRMQAWNAFYGR